MSSNEFSLVVFGMNVTGILFASIPTFLQLGFFSLTKITEKTCKNGTEGSQS